VEPQLKESIAELNCEKDQNGSGSKEMTDQWLK